MKLIDKDALVAEIEKRRNFNKELKLYSRVDECNGILYFINTLEVKDLQEEPVSGEFKKALADEWKGYIDRGAATVDALEDNTQELAFAKGFYRGSKWQKNQGVTKEAVIGMATEEISINISQSTLDALDLCAGDKVIIQIRKKED